MPWNWNYPLAAFTEITGQGRGRLSVPAAKQKLIVARKINLTDIVHCAHGEFFNSIVNTLPHLPQKPIIKTAANCHLLTHSLTHKSQSDDGIVCR